MKIFEELNCRLMLLTVFKNVKDDPLFSYFEEYCTSTDKKCKLNAYSKFVGEIYERGDSSLSRLVLKIVLEDENVYIRAKAKNQRISKEIKETFEREIKFFEDFSRISPELFSEDLSSDNLELPKYITAKIDFQKEYKNRIRKIDKFGYGIFSSTAMFRLSDDKQIEKIISKDNIELSHFIGYNEEREKVINNTKYLIAGKIASNVLLYGDAGTGKSSTVKAIANEFYKDGVRLIELRKDQLCYLPYVMGKIRDNPLKFIIFIDDLSFNQNDDNFSMLKAALEGSAAAKAENAVIYATSNRRHIVRESFSDRDGDDVHVNDTIQETLSLSERFGLVVMFSKPNKDLYLQIVHELAKRNKIRIDENKLDTEAEAFALKRGSRSARCAEQFIDSLI